MHPFRTLSALAAPLLRDNVDTDAIIPSREIKSVSKQGLGLGLFAGWRNPDFVLNQARFAAAAILVVGENFGCGSSREHAVWALCDKGFRAIIAASFAPIFHDNCVNNGLLAVCLPRDTIAALAQALFEELREPRLTIDLERQEILGADSSVIPFTIDADVRLRLLEGLDAIDLSLRKLTGLDEFYRRDALERPWVYL